MMIELIFSVFLIDTDFFQIGQKNQNDGLFNLWCLYVCLSAGAQQATLRLINIAHQIEKFHPALLSVCKKFILIINFTNLFITSACYISRSIFFFNNLKFSFFKLP